MLNNRLGRGAYLIDGHPNEVRPRRRPLHTLNAWMATDERGRLVHVGNTPGGDGQVQWNMQLLSHLTDHGLDPQQAVSAPRFSVYPGSDSDTIGKPDELICESRLGKPTLETLSRRGHRVRDDRPVGSRRRRFGRLGRPRAGVPGRRSGSAAGGGGARCLRPRGSQRLPDAPRPQGRYVPVVVHAGVAYSAGMTPRKHGQLLAHGLVGVDVTPEQAYELAGVAARNALSAIAEATGGVERLVRCLQMTVFVASGPGFPSTPLLRTARRPRCSGRWASEVWSRGPPSVWRVYPPAPRSRWPWSPR